MFRKAKILVVLITFSICLSLMSSTYSRYVVDATGNIEALFARWQILINTIDITENATSTITIEPVIEENNYIASNVVAPSSKGYFDIDVDPSNVEVSFKYTIDLEIENENIPDLIITKYAFLPDNYVEGDYLDIITLEDGCISDNLLYDKNNEEFEFKPFTIRVFFEWYEGENEQMNDEQDTTIGLQAAQKNTPLKIKANIKFEQIFG